jgi:O-antigen biosynthesis protein
MTTGLIPWQQLQPVAGAAPGTWRSSGIEPQFRRVCQLNRGWIRIHIKITCAERARAELRVDTGAGLDDALCIERFNFRGVLERDFYVNIAQTVYGIRLDPLDMEGEFRLEEFDVRPISRVALVGRTLWQTLTQVHCSWSKFHSVRAGLHLLRRGDLRGIKHQLLNQVPGHSALAPPAYDRQAAYEAWRQRHALTGADRKRMRDEAAVLPNAPLVSIIVPFTAGAHDSLTQTVDSIRRQIYPRWELCLTSGRPLPPPAQQLLESQIRSEPRMQFLKAAGGKDDINAGLHAAKGDYVTVLEMGDELAEHTLFRVAQAVVSGGLPDMLYSDEDRIDAAGRHSEPCFKPDWSPEYLLSCMYTGRLTVYRAYLVRQLGGFRSELAPAHHYDLTLRMAARTSRVLHIPDVLYHRRDDPHAGSAEQRDPSTEEAGRRALAGYVDMTGQAGSVLAGPAPLTYRVRFALKGRPLVSILLPTAYSPVTIGGEKTTFLHRCLASIRTRTTWPHYEIILLDNDEVPPGVHEALARWGVDRQAYPRPFNWAQAMNLGAARARGEHLLFLDDDTQILTPDWLECLLEYSQQSDIGAVGARLQFPDARLQHAGVTVLNGTPGHPFYGEEENHTGYFYSSVVPRNYSAVTGACLMTRADVFRELGGFHEDFAVNFNDIDYCLRVRASGRRIVCTPYARLIHYETATKAAYSPAELRRFQQRWAGQAEVDPYYNPNLSTRYHDFRVAS